MFDGWVFVWTLSDVLAVAFVALIVIGIGGLFAVAWALDQIRKIRKRMKI